MPTTDAFTIIPYGAILQHFKVDGNEIVLGFNNPEQYDSNPAYFGATIGRTANRISNAKINSLNGKEYKLAANDGLNSIHGGIKGWDKHVWSGPKEVKRPGGKTANVYKLVSEDMDEGFPGEVEVLVSYIPHRANEDGVEKEILEIEYEARLTDNQPDTVKETVINLTNHSYFNIGNKPTIEGTQATLITNKYLVIDSANIPTGEFSRFPGIESNKAFTLGPTEPDIDHCFVTSETVKLDTRDLALNTVAKFFHPDTKIHLEVATTEPAYQFYTGKHINVEARPDGSPARGMRAAFCVEPSRFVNAINQNEWRNQVVLERGNVYGSKIVFRAWKA